MESLLERSVGCPYCGEIIGIILNREDVGQRYIEDCQVCCKPIVFSVSEDATGDLSVSVRDENEAY